MWILNAQTTCKYSIERFKGGSKNINSRLAKNGQIFQRGIPCAYYKWIFSDSKIGGLPTQL